MFALSLVNIIKNDDLNPILKANYAACVDFLSWFLSFDNKDNKNTRKQLIVLKKGISCFYNAFNNDLDNKFNKERLGNCSSWIEFVINCIYDMGHSYSKLRKVSGYEAKLDKYNIDKQNVEDAVYFYTKRSGKGGK